MFVVEVAVSLCRCVAVGHVYHKSIIIYHKKKIEEQKIVHEKEGRKLCVHAVYTTTDALWADAKCRHPLGPRVQLQIIPL